MAHRVRAVLVALSMATLIAAVTVVTTPTEARAATADQIAATALGQIGGMYCQRVGGPPSVGYLSSCDPGKNWCSEFARWVWQQAGINVGGVLNAESGSFYRYGVLHNTRSTVPHVGDAVVFNARDIGGGKWDADHVGIVTAVNSSTTFTMVAGNEGVGGFTQTKVKKDGPGSSAVGSAPWGQTISGFISPVGGVDTSTAGQSVVAYNGQMHVVTLAADGSVQDTWFDGAATWSTQNLGGLVVGTPVAVSHQGSFWVFAGNVNGVVYARRYDGSSWGSWAPISTGADPVAVPYNSELHVLSRSSTGNVLDAWFNGSSWQSQNLGGVITGKPSAIQYGAQFHVVAANGGTVYHKWFDGVSTWYDWFALSTGSDPVATTFSGEFHVTSRAADSTVLDKWYNGTWYTQNLGGKVGGQPLATVYNGGIYFLAAADGVVKQKYFSGATWYDWTGVSTGSNPSLLTYLHGGINEYHVFARAADNSIVHSWYDGTYWYTQNVVP